MTILSLQNVAKRFGATVALGGVDLDVGAGEVHALIGENGAGKSTLLNILSGLLAPDAGAMRLGDAPYAPDGPAEARGRGVAHVHQELSICPHLSVAENIFLGAEGSNAWMRHEELARRATPLLAEFGRGEIDPRARCGALSLADRQVVEICRALAREARIILMDEPTSSLQRSDVERLFRLIRQLRARGIAVVYVSHFLEEVREICERFTVLRDGRSIRTGELSEVTNDELIAAMVGRSIESVFPERASGAGGSVWRPPPRRPSPTEPRAAEGGGHHTEPPSAEERPLVGGQPVLTVRDLASTPRLRSASFELRRGEILGIAGLIGSGRTELLRTLFGLQKATGGRIMNSFLPGYLSEDRKGEGLALALSIADNVTMSRLETCTHRGWLSRRAQDAQTSGIMQRLRIKAENPRMRVARLSGGNQQKVAFGRLLHQDPQILLLDEPARGVDIGSKSDIYAEIARLAREGKAILMVSSYIPELLGICDRIAVMSRGRLSAARPTKEWTADTIMEAAIGGPYAA
jgi:ribose transport system ATP-binding protein